MLASAGSTGGSKPEDASAARSGADREQAQQWTGLERAGIAAFAVLGGLAVAALLMSAMWARKWLQARRGYSNLEAQTGAAHHLAQPGSRGVLASLWYMLRGGPAGSREEQELAQRDEGWMDRPGSVVLVPVPSDMSTYRGGL